MAKDDELEARERIARNLLASVGRKDCETMDERDLARNAAQAMKNGGDVFWLVFIGHFHGHHANKGWARSIGLIVE